MRRRYSDSEASTVDRARVRLTRNEESGTGVRIAQVRCEGLSAVEHDAWNASDGVIQSVTNPVSLAELRRATDEECLALHFVILLPEDAGLLDGRSVVVGRVRAGIVDPTPIRPAYESQCSDSQRKWRERTHRTCRPSASSR